jgi:NTP pyrophosphatase (non-canonical NTP hydrolase)
MTVERSNQVLEAGLASALEKMSSARCLPKKEITDFSFLELYARLLMEVRELEDEVRKARTDHSDTEVSLGVLKAIRAEAGDVISFASGLVAKADAEISAVGQPELPGFEQVI